MTNRKKRLEKGVESINKQIELHKEKRLSAINEGKIELADYYEREIIALDKSKKKKEEKLEK